MCEISSGNVQDLVFRLQRLSLTTIDNSERIATFQLSQTTTILPSGEENILLVPISEIVVHMILCEWPQNWPTMMTELMEMSKQGTFQTKVVLASLLRLSQDVMHYDNVPGRRKKDILSALHDNMNDIFNFCLSTTMEQVTQCQNATNNLLLMSQSQSLCKESIVTLTGFLDWVKMEFVCQQEGLLFQILVKLLPGNKNGLSSGDPSSSVIGQISIKAMEAMLVALSRKDKLDARQLLLVVIENDVIFQHLLACTRHMAKMDKPLEHLTETEFEFLNRLCAFMVNLGCLVVASWPDRYKAGKPPNWNFLLECMIFFSQHPSNLIAVETCEFWICLFNQDCAVIQQECKPLVSRLHDIWLSALRKKQCDILSRQLLEMDDYNLFFPKIRSLNCRCLHVCAKACPVESMQYLLRQLDLFVEKINSFESNFDLIELEADAIVLYTETIMKSIVSLGSSEKGGGKSDSNTAAAADYGGGGGGGDGVGMAVLNDFQCHGESHLRNFLRLADVCIVRQQNAFYTDGLKLLPILMDFIKNFLIFMKPKLDQLMPDYLTKMFIPMQWRLHDELTKEQKNLISNLHLNCSTNFVRATQTYPQFFMAFFDQLLNCVRDAVMTGGIGGLQRSLLLQGMVTLSAEFKCYDKQRSVIENLYESYLAPWYSAELQTVVNDTQQFLTFFGFMEPANGPNKDLFQNRRNLILSSINTLLFCLRYSQIPSNKEDAEKGGFYQIVNGQRIARNPVNTCIMPILPHLFSFLNCLNILNSENGVSMVHSSFQPAFVLSKHVKLIILGKVSSDEMISKKPTDESTSKPMDETLSRHLSTDDLAHANKFISVSYETLCHFLGFAFSVLGEELYSVPTMGQSVLRDIAFRNIVNLKNYKLHILLKYFVRPLIVHCSPAHYESVLIPVIPVLISATFIKLEKHWQLYATSSSVTVVVRENLADDEDGDDDDDRDELSDEVIEEHCTRLLTRTVLDILKLILSSAPRGTQRHAAAKENDKAIQDTEMEDVDQQMGFPEQALGKDASATSPWDVQQLSELGCLICRLSHVQPTNGTAAAAVEMPCANLLLAALSQSITWPDTQVCHRAVPLIYPLVKEMHKHGLLSEDVVTQIFNLLLNGLAVNGQHRDLTLPFLLNAIVNVYETYRPTMPRLCEVLLAATSTPLPTIQSFEQKLLNNAKRMNDRNKRDSVRKIVEPLIGVPLSEKYREKIKIMNLPPLGKVKWKASGDVLEKEASLTNTQDIAGLCSLFHDA